MNASKPLLIAFCGPNGAGKSTLRQLTLAELTGIPFINADEIAVAVFGKEQAASKAYEAAAMAEEQRQAKLLAGESFSFETVMSHVSKVEFLQQAREAGYVVIAHFVGLDSAERSRARVIQRVFNGGHDVPDDKIEARYARVIENLGHLLDVPDELVIYDNSSADDPYRVVARLELGRLTHLAVTVPSWLALLNLESRQPPDTLRLS